jgi:hypothetical protein
MTPREFVGLTCRAAGEAVRVFFRPLVAAANIRERPAPQPPPDGQKQTEVKRPQTRAPGIERSRRKKAG